MGFELKKRQKLGRNSYEIRKIKTVNRIYGETKSSQHF